MRADGGRSRQYPAASSRSCRRLRTTTRATRSIRSAYREALPSGRSAAPVSDIECFLRRRATDWPSGATTPCACVTEESMPGPTRRLPPSPSRKDAQLRPRTSRTSPVAADSCSCASSSHDCRRAAWRSPGLAAATRASPSWSATSWRPSPRPATSTPRAWGPRPSRTRAGSAGSNRTPASTCATRRPCAGWSTSTRVWTRRRRSCSRSTSPGRASTSSRCTRSSASPRCGRHDGEAATILVLDVERHGG